MRSIVSTTVFIVHALFGKYRFKENCVIVEYVVVVVFLRMRASGYTR